MIRTLLMRVAPQLALAILVTTAMVPIAAPALAQSAISPGSGSGSVITLQPPGISDYWVTVSLQPGGVLVFDGYVPDEPTRQALAENQGADVSFLKLGSGAPAGYRAALDFGLDLLAHMSEGRVSLSGTTFNVSGIARTPTDYLTIRSRLALAVPQGIELGTVDTAAPRAAQYEFVAARADDGAIHLSGMLPDPALEQRLLAEAGQGATADIAYMSGEPTSFVDSVGRALDFLPWLKSGQVRFNGTNWIISGTPASVIDLGSIQTEFAVQNLAQAGWSLDLAPPAAAPQPVSPYTWSAERLPDGSFVFAGNVPAASLKDYLAIHAGARVTDTSKVSPGAPEGFAASVRGAVDALLELEQGTSEFDGVAWSFAGKAADAESRAASLALASSALGIDASDIVVAPIPDPQAPPLQRPQPTEVADPPAEPARAAPIASGTTPELLAQCSARLAELSAHNAILFQSGAAIIAPGAAPELDAFAQVLLLCPEADIYVEGHTDSDGDARQNLALSVARAEAVIDALVERGASPDHLYAIGYGESQPVADNATADGKRQNRRIVVSLRNEL